MTPQVLSLFLFLTQFKPHTFADTPPRLVRDGIASIWGFPGVSYKAVNYIPVCGALTLTNTDQYEYFTTEATCDASMNAYNQTSDTSNVYDYTGTLSSEQIGTGSPVCLCFSLGGAPGQMDLCINILSDGTPEHWYPTQFGDVVGGTFVSNADKALPLCKDVDVASLSASAYSKLGATRSDSAPEPTTSSILLTTTSGSVVRTFTALVVAPTENPPTGDSGNRTASRGAEREYKVAMGVGLGMVSISISAEEMVVEYTSSANNHSV